MFARLFNSSHIVSTTIARDMITVSKTGPMNVVGLPKLKVLWQNLSVGSALPRANRARDKATQMVVSSWHYPGPHRGYLTSSSFVSESRPKGFLRVPLCGLASSHPGSPNRDYLGMMHETTYPGFALGGGGAPLWSYGEVLAHAASHPRTVT
jgi:hypothetical protein